MVIKGKNKRGTPIAQKGAGADVDKDVGPLSASRCHSSYPGWEP